MNFKLKQLAGEQSDAKLLVFSFFDAEYSGSHDAPSHNSCRQTIKGLSLWLSNHFELLTLNDAIRQCRSGELTNPTACIAFHAQMHSSSLRYKIFNEAKLPMTLFLSDTSYVAVQTSTSDVRSMLDAISPNLISPNLEIGAWIRASVNLNVIHSSSSSNDKTLCGSYEWAAKSIDELSTATGLPVKSTSLLHPTQDRKPSPDLLLALTRNRVTQSISNSDGGYFSPGNDPLQVPSSTLNNVSIPEIQQNIRSLYQRPPNLVPSRGYEKHT